MALIIEFGVALVVTADIGGRSDVYHITGGNITITSITIHSNIRMALIPITTTFLPILHNRILIDHSLLILRLLNLLSYLLFWFGLCALVYIELWSPF